MDNNKSFYELFLSFIESNFSSVSFLNFIKKHTNTYYSKRLCARTRKKYRNM